MLYILLIIIAIGVLLLSRVGRNLLMLTGISSFLGLISLGYLIVGVVILALIILHAGEIAGGIGQWLLIISSWISLVFIYRSVKSLLVFLFKNPEPKKYGDIFKDEWKKPTWFTSKD